MPEIFLYSRYVFNRPALSFSIRSRKSGPRGPRGAAAARPLAIPGVRRYAPAASPGKAPPVPIARPLAEADAALDGREGGRVVGRYAPQP